MQEINFSLRPFPGSYPLPGMAITGSIGRKNEALTIGYRLSGPLWEIAIPGSAAKSSRRIGLWENTCFEFFIGEPGMSRYWEFNLSPSGDWNVFRFEEYRQGLYEEKDFSALPFETRLEPPDIFLLNLKFDLGIIIQADRAVEVAVSAVIRTKAGQETLWALTHPASKADFHHRSGFIIRL